MGKPCDCSVKCDRGLLPSKGTLGDQAPRVPPSGSGRWVGYNPKGSKGHYGTYIDPEEKISEPLLRPAHCISVWV